MQLDYHFQYTENELREDWKRLCNVHEFKSGSQWKPGLKISQHFCKNFFDIETKNGKSFSKAWNDPVLMDKVRLWGLEKMSALYMSWIRRAVYMASGMHNPSFYRPHLARQIIKSTKTSNGVLFDPCAGWGGRMLGTVSAGWNYIGCEPNKTTYNHLLEIIEFLDISNYVTLYNIPCEDMNMSTISNVNIVLTSPPYFNLETYVDDATQSYMRHPSYDGWLKNWYLPMVEKNIALLNENGLSCYNVMDGLCKDIVYHTNKIHDSHGFTMIGQLGIDSPFVNYKKKLNKKDLTYIFKRIDKLDHRV